VRAFYAGLLDGLGMGVAGMMKFIDHNPENSLRIKHQ
jgi:hypothetical protein